MDLWDDDLVQFARLLDEIAAVGLDNNQLVAISESMDLTEREVQGLFDRATAVWEKAKAERQDIAADEPDTDLTVRQVFMPERIGKVLIVTGKPGPEPEVSLSGDGSAGTLHKRFTYDGHEYEITGVLSDQGGYGFYRARRIG